LDFGRSAPGKEEKGLISNPKALDCKNENLDALMFDGWCDVIDF